MSKDEIKYKVTYFPGKGGGEILRLVLSAAGKKFEDVRLPRDDWMKFKSENGPGCPPSKQMPFLTVTAKGRDFVLGQSGACARYLAKKFDLFGSTPEETAIIDEAYECVMDAQKEIFKIFFEKDEGEKAKMIDDFKTVVLKRLEEYIVSRSKDYGQDGYIVGKSMTLADLQLYNLVDQGKDRVGADTFSAYPELIKHAGLVQSNSNIAKWIAEMPKPQF